MLELGAVGRVRVWSVQEFGPWGTLIIIAIVELGLAVANREAGRRWAHISCGKKWVDVQSKKERADMYERPWTLWGGAAFQGCPPLS